MTVYMAGKVNFDGCLECKVDFMDLIQLLDRFTQDDILPELEKWYPLLHDSPIIVKLPCGGTVSLEWDLGLGKILSGRC